MSSLVHYLLPLLLLIIVVDAAKIPRIPSYVKLCKRTDPELNRCLVDSVERLRPYLIKGIPEFRIPPYDPLRIPQVQLSEGEGRPVSFVATFSDIEAFGASNAKVRDVSVDLDKLMVKIDLLLPKLRLLANYTINGRVLLVPIQGEGRFDGNFTDTHCKLTLSGVADTRKGLTFASLKGRHLDIEIAGMRIDFANLFNGNQELGRATNNFFNENWRDLMTELRPILEDTIAELIHGIVRPIFDLFPLEHLLPFD